MPAFLLLPTPPSFREREDKSQNSRVLKGVSNRVEHGLMEKTDLSFKKRKDFYVKKNVSKQGQYDP